MDSSLETKLFPQSMGFHLCCCSWGSSNTHGHTNSVFCHSSEIGSTLSIASYKLKCVLFVFPVRLLYMYFIK